MMPRLGILAALLSAVTLTLMGCSSETGKEFARALFPDLEFSRVLASKLRQSGGHGCTYVVLELPENAPQSPPKVVPQWRGQSYAREGEWRPTPVVDRRQLDARVYCLTGDQDRIDGAQIDGYGAGLMALLLSEGAWVSVYGSGEGQILMLYAPAARRALHLRYGD